MDVDKTQPATRVARLARWFAADRKRRWWILVLFLAALFVRLYWNLKVHPLGEYIYSDMKGYWGRADKMLEEPFMAREYDAFFPFGTTWLIAGIKYVFGRDNFTAVSIIYALFGASIVAMAYSIVDRVMGREVPWVAPATGLLLVVYYPLIAVGGYVLSELPFSLCLTLSLWLLIRLVEDGRGHHAWLLGLTLGVGTLIRSQMLLSVALVGAFWLAFRVAYRKRPEQNPYAKLRWAHIGFIAVPLGLLLTMSAIRFHVHTGRYGLVSENSSINLIFGRCHNKGIYSRRDNEGHGTIRFSPPPLIQFEAESEKNPDDWIRIRSVFGEHPEAIDGVPGFAVDEFGCTRRKCRLPGSEIEYRGYIGDGDIHAKIVKACIERGGLGRQAYFTVSHWVLLWAKNKMWPDQANPKPRSSVSEEGWRHRQVVWGHFHRIVLMVPALLGLGFVFAPRRRPGQALVALNLWALMVVAGVWIGGMRFRVPYDPIIIMLAMFTYAVVWQRLRELWQRRRGAKAPTAEPTIETIGDP